MPVGSKVSLVSVILGQLAYVGFPLIVTRESFRGPEYVYNRFGFAFAATLQFAFYWRLTKHLSRLTKVLRAEGQPVLVA